MPEVTFEGILSPLIHAHINVPGRYTFTLAEQVTKDQLSPLKQAEETDEWPLWPAYLYGATTVLNVRLGFRPRQGKKLFRWRLP